MDPQLERLIRLQALDNATQTAGRDIEEIPKRLEAAAARLADHEQRVAAAKERLAANQAVRRDIEKELAAVQTRLSRFKGQLMEVKTNKEYQAMQKEIAVAEEEVRGFEDRILELMLDADGLAAAIREEERVLGDERRAIDDEKRAIEQERRRLEATVERLATERVELTRELAADALALFDHVAKMRRGLAVVEARNGHCTSCHVRLRPQVFNDVRRNAGLIQCESCSRILYFVPAPAPEPAA